MKERLVILEGLAPVTKTACEKIKCADVGGPLIVSFTVTRKCNFNCLHCFNCSGSSIENDLSDEQLYGIAMQISEVKPSTVCICGGEPILRKNIVYKIIKQLSNHCGAVNMVSNGYLITQDIINQLKENGLLTLQISLDGDTPFLHDNFRGRSGSFKMVQKAIEFGVKSQLNMAISFIPNRLNYKSFSNVCKLCYELGVSDVRVMPLIPMGRGSNIKELLLNPEEYIILQQNIIELKEEYVNLGMNVEWGDPIDHLYRMPKNDKAGIKTYSMDILNGGDLAVTCYLPIIVGNLLKHSLKDYWNAGYSNIWGNKSVVEYVSKIENIYDFDKFEPRPYSGDIIYMDLIENKGV